MTSRPAPVRSRTLGPPSAATHVVVLPGLGLPSYVLPTAEALAGRGLACTVLDLPGFGSARGRSCSPHIDAMGTAAAGWVGELPTTQRVVLLGHSTGSQAALTAALTLQDSRPDTALVMAGPTFAPGQRGWGSVALATTTAYRRDSLREAVVVPEVLRGNVDVVRIIASGLQDRPEERVAGLRVPLALTAGRADTYAPAVWLEQLAAAAVLAPRVATSVLPGSHNNLFTHPEDLADVVTRALAG